MRILVAGPGALRGAWRECGEDPCLGELNMEKPEEVFQRSSG